MSRPAKYQYPHKLRETVVIPAESRAHLRRIAWALYHAAYRREHVVRCRTSREEMAVRVTRVV